MPQLMNFMLIKYKKEAIIMTNQQALALHNEDEVTVKNTQAVATVIQSYLNENNQVIIETTYNGFTEFCPDEIE